MWLPPSLIKNISSTYGEKGQQWLQDLPQLVALYEQMWQFSAQTCFIDANFNYVAPVILHNGGRAVIKLGLPEKEFLTEIRALTYFNGVGAVKLLQAEPEQGAMLLEHISPGTLLEQYDDSIEHVSSVAVNLLKKLVRVEIVSTEFPTLHAWFKGFERLYIQFEGSTGPFPRQLIEDAMAISAELLATMQHKVLLHGDLHYANILYAGEQNWVAIDPKGVIGEIEYEIPLPRVQTTKNKAHLIKLIESFIDISAFDKHRIWKWLFVKAMLAAWWSFEDSKITESPFLWVAENTYKYAIKN